MYYLTRIIIMIWIVKPSRFKRWMTLTQIKPEARSQYRYVMMKLSWFAFHDVVSELIIESLIITLIILYLKMYV